jgi:hypothetical protein
VARAPAQGGGAAGRAAGGARMAARGAHRPASPFMGPRVGRQARGGGGGVTAPHSGQAWQPGPDGPSAGLRRLSGLGRASGSAQSGRVDILFFSKYFSVQKQI